MINSLPQFQINPNVYPNIGKQEFERMFGLVLEGSCPVDGSRLERRPNFGYALCPECKSGWMAGTGDWRWVHQYLANLPHSRFSYDEKGNVDEWRYVYQ